MSESLVVPERRALAHFLVPAIGNQQEILLDGDEGHHARAVRRVRPDEMVCLTDGAGDWAIGRVVGLEGRGGVRVALLQRGFDTPDRPEVTVVQALIKGDRSTLAVELLTEVGVDRIVPWQADRSVVNWRADRAERGLARWRRAAQEAAKQSRRVRVPVVEDPVDSTSLQQILRTTDSALICHEGAHSSLADQEISPGRDVVVVIGPEGGISPAELSAMREAGAQPVSLGGTVLRASSAGAVAAAWVLAAAGRWRDRSSGDTNPDTAGGCAP